jgi:hypothetical protein
MKRWKDIFMKVEGIERAADEVRTLIAEIPEGLESVLTNAIRSSRPYAPPKIKIIECRYVNNEVLFYKAHRDREYDPDYVLKDSDVYTVVRLDVTIEWGKKTVSRGLLRQTGERQRDEVQVSVFSDGTRPFVFWKNHVAEVLEAVRRAVFYTVRAV